MTTLISKLCGFPDHRVDEFTAMVSCFRFLVVRWRLADSEVDALLFEQHGFLKTARGGCDHLVLTAESERRMRRCLQLDCALRSRPGALPDVAEWLRRPNPCIRAGQPLVDMSPLAAMTRDPGALATIRDLVVEEL